ncbi:hypothetical protein DFS34DRAFT_344201 [Phlyctochytrium arcticum]|nr:hypothetical protein DFS34DRAFT_344201 [Phlyctochytrium arcticum]
MSLTRTTLTAAPPQTTMQHQKPHVVPSPLDLYFTPTRSNVGLIAKVSLQSTHGTRPIGYKLKTNAPARYSVKPVLGVLWDGKSLDVLVRSEGGLHPQDRFLLQTVVLTEEEAKDLDAAKWKTLDRRRMVDTFLDCKHSSLRLRGSNDSLTTQSTIPQPQPSPPPPSYNPSTTTQTQTDLSVRVTKLDLIVFSCLCLVLGILMPYRSLLHMVGYPSLVKG